MKKIFGVFILFLTYISYADEIIKDASKELKDELAQSVYEPNYFSMILGLFVIVFLIYITGYIYQKLTKVKLSNENIYLNKAQIISTTPLGQGKNLHIIKIGDEACLIGSTQNNISFIKDVKLQEDKENEINE